MILGSGLNHERERRASTALRCTPSKGTGMGYVLVIVIVVLLAMLMLVTLAAALVVRTRSQGKVDRGMIFSVEPVEIGLTTLEGARDGID